MWHIKAVFGVVVLGALVATDFVAGNNARPEGEKLSFVAYLGERTSMVAAVIPAAPVMDAALAAALPVAPAGWTRNPAAAGDVAGMLVPAAQDVVSGGGGEPGVDVRRIVAVGQPGKAAGLQTAAFTYDYGHNRVVIEVLRHPDSVITDASQTAAKMRLQTWVMDEGAEKVGEVAGMDVWQARLSPGLGARMLIAGIGGQVQLRAVYPERMKAASVVRLLEGLDVAALNSGVVEPDAAVGAALAAAAPAGDAGFMGAMAGMLFGTAAVAAPDTAVADTAPEEVAQAEPAPKERASRMPTRGGRAAKITVGTGACGDRGGGKFCSVTGPETD